MSAPAAEPVLRARGLALGYGSRTVLEGVDLDVRPGEVWFLLGPNGSGKTTLLRAVLGLLPPRAGALVRDPARAGRERIGFVPQVLEVNPALPTTVREFVSLGLVRSDVPRAGRGEALAWALRHAGLSGLADADFWSLSGGQRRRALVARALVRRPELLVLDEPTEGLDVVAEEAFLETLERLNRGHGVAILFVTHRLAIAARHATHVALFHAGSVVAGPADRVLSHPHAARAFGPLAGRLGAGAPPADGAR